MDIIETPPRVALYLARVDEHLLNELNTRLERKQFLERELSQWEREHSRFIATDGASIPDTVLTDLTLTIAGLRTRYGSVT